MEELMNKPTIINTALLPSDYDPQDYLKQMQDTGIMPVDTSIYDTPSITSISYSDLMEEKINRMECTIQSLTLKIYVLEGRLSREEADNLLNMLSSEDEASKSLAGKIINKFKDNEYNIQ